MKPEIKQLLQHEDHANRLIGCWLAWHAGYGTIDIADVIINIPISTALDDAFSRFIGSYGISVRHSSLRNKWGKRRLNKSAYTFVIYIKGDGRWNPIQKVNIETTKNSTLFNKTFNHFKHMFIEYILSEE